MGVSSRRARLVPKQRSSGGRPDYGHRKLDTGSCARSAIHGARSGAWRVATSRSEKPARQDAGSGDTARRRRRVSETAAVHSGPSERGKIRPLAALQHRTCERAESARKRSSAEDFDCAKRGRSRDMAVIPVCRTQALEGAWMPWAAEDEPRWAAVAVWGEPRQSVPVRRRQGSAEEARDRGRRFVQGRTDDAAAREKFPELAGPFSPCVRYGVLLPRNLQDSLIDNRQERTSHEAHSDDVRFGDGRSDRVRDRRSGDLQRSPQRAGQRQGVADLWPRLPQLALQPAVGDHSGKCIEALARMGDVHRRAVRRTRGDASLPRRRPLF